MAGSHLFLSWRATQKDCFSWFIRILKVLLRQKVIHKGGLCALRLFPLMTEFSVFMHFQGIAPANSWLWLQSYIKNKNKGIENKIILLDLHCTINKMDRDGGTKTRRIYRCRSNYALSKLILGFGFEDLWRIDDPHSSEFTRYDRSSGTRSRMYMIYNDMIIATKNLFF